MGVSLKKILDDLPEERRTRIEKHGNRLIEEIKTLQELRKSLGITQVQLAKKQGVNQVNISNFENRKDMLLSTLNNYIRSLGCELEIIVKTPDDQKYKIHNLPTD